MKSYERVPENVPPEEIVITLLLEALWGTQSGQRGEPNNSLRYAVCDRAEGIRYRTAENSAASADEGDGAARQTVWRTTKSE